MESKKTGMITVSDGEYTWMYDAAHNEYTKVSAALGPAGVMAAMGIKLPSETAKVTYRTVGEEVIEVDGEKHDCWVIEQQVGEMIVRQSNIQAALTGSLSRVWIDKKLSLDLKSVHTASYNMTGPAGQSKFEVNDSSLKTHIVINGPLPDSLFVFTPPEGAVEVKELTMFPKKTPSELIGKDAPAFELAGLDGKVYSLAALKGKSVLLDFWATWCVPCRKSMPQVEEIYRAQKDRGLVVIGVDVEEERQTVEQFVKTAPFAYPITLSGESGILTSYQVTAYPTFVLIGPDGKIVAYEVGGAGPYAIMEKLAAASQK